MAYLNTLAKITPPPAATRWGLMASAGNPSAPIDMPLGVQFKVTATQVGYWAKAPSVLGGSHVITALLDTQILPAGVSDAALLGFFIASGGTIFECVPQYNQNSIRMVVQRLTYTTPTAGTTWAANIAYPWANDPSPAPYGPHTWRVTFDDTNVTFERAPLGGAYYTMNGSTAHGCGSITKVGVKVAGNATEAVATLLSYVET